MVAVSTPNPGNATRTNGAERSWLPRSLAAFHAHFTRRPPSVPAVYQDVFALTHYTYWGGLFIHIGLLVAFYGLGLTGLALFNCASIVVFGLTIHLSRRGWLHTALLVGGLEVALHQVYATLVLGLAAGFHFYLLILSFATLLYVHLPVVQRVVMAIAPVLLYAALYTYGLFHAPSVQLAPGPLAVFATLNLFAFMILMLGICYYFVDTARVARIAAEDLARAKTIFLANMSHELRTPMNAILGFAQILSRSDALTAEDRRNLATIDRSSEHLLELINSVLDMSKIEDGKLTLSTSPVDLPALAADLGRMFSLAASRKHLEFTVDLDPDLPRVVLADELKLKQVLINLLNNALKFTAAGRVTLSVRAEPSADAPPVSHRRRLRFAVADTGPGISREEQAQLFQLFTQTTLGRRSGVGTGLGLALSQGLVRLMGGTIEVASDLGHGAVFSFSIETEIAAASAVPGRSAARALALEPGQPAFRLLVVDDNEDNREVLLQLLRKLGFTVTSARDGEEAVALWREFSPHLTWMDLQMPVMDGYEATRLIKDLARDLDRLPAPVVAITASALQGERQRIRDIGCDDFLTKPFREEDIVAALERHLGARFIRETPSSTTDSSDTGTTTDWPARFSRLPAADLDALRASVAALDLDSAQRAADTVAQSDPELAGRIRALLQDYRFDTLTEELSQAAPPSA